MSGLNGFRKTLDRLSCFMELEKQKRLDEFMVKLSQMRGKVDYQSACQQLMSKKVESK